MQGHCAQATERRGLEVIDTPDTLRYLRFQVGLLKLSPNLGSSRIGRGVLALILLLFASTPTVFAMYPVPSPTLTFGQTVAGSISTPAQKNSYTFTANANDLVDFTAATTGALSPLIQVYLGGTLIASANPAFCEGSTVELNTVLLKTAGSYTVLVSDCSETNTGAYTLYLQRTNNPTNPNPLPFSSTESGSITSATQSNTYTFHANADDYVDLTMTASGALSPKLRLYYPDGTQAAIGNPSFCEGSTIELNPQLLSQSGTYTLLVGDCSDVNVGNYELYAQRTDNPQDANLLTYGQTVSGKISEAAQSNTYTLAGNANDRVDLTAVTSGNLNPSILIYKPDGTLLTSASPSFCQGSTVEVNALVLPVTGSYPVLIGDCSNTNTGGYWLSTQRTKNPTGSTPLTFGATQAGSITEPAQSNTYTITANAKDVLDLTMTTTTGALSPKLRVYNPDGTPLSAANPSFCEGSTVELNTLTIPVTGTYTVLVGDCSDTNSGNYEIYVQRINSPSGSIGVDWGVVQTGKIASSAQNNTYVFYGTKNNAVELTMVATSGALSPRLRLYNPDASLLLTDNPNFCEGSVTATNSVTLGQTGVYTLLVGDCSDTNTGTYNLSSQCLAGACPVTPTIAWPAPAPITYPKALSGMQLDATATVNGTPVPGNYNYVPKSGTLLNPGTYTLSVTFTPKNGSAYTTATASVSLTVNPGTKKAPVCTWPTPAAITYGTPLSGTQLDASCSVPGTYVYSPAAGKVLNAGVNALSVTFTPTDTTDYTSATVSVNLTVNKRALTVTAKPATIPYDQPIPPFSYAFSGFVNGDTAAVVSGAPAETTTAKQGSLPGTYPITITQGSLNALNYSFQFVNGTLTITAPRVSLSATALSFGTQSVGTASLQSVTLTNSGNAALVIDSIEIAGSGLSSFFSSDSCGAGVAAGASCKIWVVFYPTTVGPLTAAVTITDDAVSPTQSIGLSGTGK